MRSFDRWFADQKQPEPAAPLEPHDDGRELPDGLHWDGFKYTAYCVSCGDEFEVEYRPEEGFDQDFAYCNAGAPKYCQP